LWHSVISQKALIFRITAVRIAISQIRNLFCGYRFLVRVSHIEIYNEEIRDLLGKDQTAHLEVKERPDIGVYIRDLSGYVVNNADDMERIMTLGNKNSK